MGNLQSLFMDCTRWDEPHIPDMDKMGECTFKVWKLLLHVHWLCRRACHRWLWVSHVRYILQSYHCDRPRRHRVYEYYTVTSNDTNGNQYNALGDTLGQIPVTLTG